MVDFANLLPRDIRSFEHSSSAFAEFHSDHSFEINPPSYTMLRMVKAPEYGIYLITTMATVHSLTKV